MAQTVYSFGNCLLDPASRKLTRHGNPVSLPLLSLECIVYLIQNQSRAVGKDELISAVWGRADISDALLSQTLSRARRAVNDSGKAQTRIKTVPGFGYQWVGDFTVVENEPPPDVIASEDNIEIPPERHRAWLIQVGLLGLLVVAVVWIVVAVLQNDESTPRQPLSVTNTSHVIVLPVVINPESPEFTWVRLGAMDFIASRLRESSDLTVLPSEQTLRLAGDNNHQEDDEALVRQVRDKTGAGLIVLPSAEMEEDGWRIRLRLDADDETLDVDAKADTLLAAAAVASDVLLRRLGFNPSDEPAPSLLTERLQHVDAELLAGQLATARSLIFAAPPEQRQAPQMKILEGQLEFRAGRLEAAEKLFSDILKATPPPSPQVGVQALSGLGGVALRQKHFAESAQLYDEAVALVESSSGDIKDQTLVGNAYNGRGVSRMQLDQLEDGITDLGRARITMKRAGDELGAASVSGNIGMLEAKRGNGERALQEFDRSIDTFERFGVDDHLATILMAKASTELQLLLPIPALTDSRRALKISETLENPQLLAAIELVHVDALLANGLLAEADTWLSRIESGAERRRLRWLLESGEPENARQEAKLLEPAQADTDLALLVVQTALLTDDEWLLADWLPQGDRTLNDFESLFARALASDRTGSSFTGLEVRFEAALKAASLQGLAYQEVRVASAWVTKLVAIGQMDRASAVLGRINLYVERDYRAARAALDLYTALDDSTMQRKKAEIVKRLAGERDPILPVIY